MGATRKIAAEELGVCVFMLVGIDHADRVPFLVADLPRESTFLTSVQSNLRILLH